MVGNRQKGWVKCVLFFFRISFAGVPRKSFVIFMVVQGCLLFCISTMILVALQNISLIDVLCNRKYFLFVKLIFSVFIFP